MRRSAAGMAWPIAGLGESSDALSRDPSDPCELAVAHFPSRPGSNRVPRGRTRPLASLQRLEEGRGNPDILYQPNGGAKPPSDPFLQTLCDDGVGVSHASS